MTSTPQDGWYQDPVGQRGSYRYWSGGAWTEHTYDAATAAGAASPPFVYTPYPQYMPTRPPPPEYMVRPQVRHATVEEPTRQSLKWETWVVMIAFLLPVVASAVVVFAQHVTGVGAVTRFPIVVQGHPLENMLIGMLAYLPVACTVPLALYLLYRTGQGPRVLGLELPGFRSDIIPAVGIGLASFGTEIAVLLPLTPILTAHSRLNSPTPIGSVPHYYVIYGLMVSATTAVAEEVVMNGYLMTRLGQLSWTPRSALILGVLLRTSYHVYYGIGFIATIPFAYFVTRSFQKNGRLTRVIAAHFLFDAVLITIAVFR